MAHLTHLDTHARTVPQCLASCFSTDYKAASVDDMHAVCFEHDSNAAFTQQSLLSPTLLAHQVVNGIIFHINNQHICSYN